MVLVPVQATRDDSPLLDLSPRNFHVFENGQEQAIRYFAQDDSPVSVGLLLDSSASMKNKTGAAARAAAAFVRTANVEDEFFLIKFDEEARLTLRFTSDTQVLQKEVEHFRPNGRTALYDAVQLGLETMKKARHRRKALVIISDGADNRSRRNFSTVRRAVVESDVQIYALGIFDPTPENREETVGPDLLAQLAEVSGGRHFPVELQALEQTTERLGRLIRNEYVLGYNPSDMEKDGTYRKITIRFESPEGPASLKYRPGYYALSR